MENEFGELQIFQDTIFILSVTKGHKFENIKINQTEYVFL